MTLATHSIVGLGLASAVFPASPVGAFAIALASHYLSDMIPHWQYEPPFIRPNEEDRLSVRFSNGWGRWVRSLLMIGLDLLIGVAIGLWIFEPYTTMSTLSIAVSVIGAILPDLLQPLYFIFPREPFRSIQRFHNSFHSKQPHIKEKIKGITYQAAFVLAVVLVVYLIK